MNEIYANIINASDWKICIWLIINYRVLEEQVIAEIWISFLKQYSYFRNNLYNFKQVGIYWQKYML